MLFIIYLLACIGAHRLWNFEAIFQGPRDWLLRYRWAKPLTCQACNAFWIAATLAVPYYFADKHAAPWYYLDERAALVALGILAAYAVQRGILWVYRAASHWDTIWRMRAAPTVPPRAAPAGSASGPLPAGTVMLPEKAAPGCSDCEAKKSAAVAAQSRALSFKRRVVLLTTLSGFPPSYSVATVICDQARMLAMDPTWFVQIWVNESANLAGAPKDFPLNVEIVRCVPTVSRMEPDQWAAADADRIASAIRLNLMKLGNAMVISHDLLFLRTHVAYAAALHSLGEIRGFAWMHVCHSAAGARPALGTGSAARLTLPPGHKLLCLNPSQRESLARYYDTTVDNVLVCPNARDIVSWYDFHPIAAELTRQYGLDQADIVQVFPVCATRLEPKGVGKVIEIFSWLCRNHRLDCRLVLAVANAGGPREQAALAGLRTRALNLGMGPDQLIITSEDFPDTAVGGIPHRAVRDLFLVSNVFVFPSLSEASSLVLGEAALAGCLIVGNTELRETDNLLGVDQLRYDFGSLRQPLTDVKLDGVALDILRALDHSQANRSKRKMLYEFNFTTVGKTLRTLVEDLPLH